MKNSNTNTKKVDATFLSQTAPLNLVLALILIAASLWLTVTTSFSLYAMIADSVQELPLLFFVLVVLGVILIGAVIIDLGNGLIMQFYFLKKATITQEQKKNKSFRSFLNLIIALTSIRLLVSAFLTFVVTPEVSIATTSESEHDAYLAQLDSIQADKQKQLTILRNEKSQTQARESARVKLAKKEGDQAIRAAIYSGNAWQEKSYREQGFAWIASRHPNNTAANRKYADRIRKAIAKKEALIAAAKSKTQIAEDIYLHAQEDTLHQQQAATLLYLADSENKMYERTITRRTNYLYILDFICVLVIPFLSYVLVQRMIAAQYEPHSKSLIYVLQAAAENKYVQWIESLERRWNIDIDGNGVVGTVATSANLRTGKKAITASVPVAPKNQNRTDGTDTNGTDGTLGTDTNGTDQKMSANTDSSLFQNTYGTDGTLEDIEMEQIIVMDNKHVFPHHTSNGTLYLSEGQVNGRLRKAIKRLDEAQRKIDNGNAHPKTVASISNRKQNVAYWQAAKNKFL